MISNPAHDLLLLLLNLSQQKSADRVRATFIDAVSALFAPVGLRWLEPEDEFEGELIAVATLKKEFGRIAVIPSGQGDVAGMLPLLHNAASMLAVILEKFETDHLLADEKLLLQDQVEVRAAELSRTNRDLKQEIEERRQIEETLRESERALNDAQRITHIGSWVWILTENQATCSKEMLRIWGHDPAKGSLSMQEMAERLHPEDREKVLAAMDRSEKNSTRFDVEHRIILPDGGECFIHGIGEIVVGEDVEPRAMCGTCQDITEARRVEEALRESEEKFKHSFDNVPVGMSMTLPSGEVRANRAMYKMLGYPEGSPELKWQEITHPDDLSFSQQFVDSVISGKKESGSFIKRYLHRDGSIVWVELSATIRRDEEGRPRYFLTAVNDITNRKAAEEALRDSEERLELAITGASIGMWDWNVSTGEVTNSERWLGMLEYEPGELVNEFSTVEALIHQEDREDVLNALNSHFEDENCEYNVEFRLKTKSGGWKWVNSRGRVFSRDENNQPLRMVGTHIDITERKAAEEERSRLEVQLHQSQKMEAVGRLAGGVAHDFNNILTGIIGFAELSQATLGPGDPILADLEEIRKAADRAADLTAQLLAFSRKQIIHPMVIQPNDVLQNSQKMLRRIIGEDIDFLFKPFRDLWRIKADTGQLDQILVNLAVNARDALPSGGRLTVETQNVTLDEEYSRTHEGMEPGDFVMLAVTDNGQGMDADTLEHIFEPFYSTKGKDQGTGLGLSTVYGIMKQNNGFINVYSEPGTGTTFKIYFPAVMEKADIIIPRDVVTHATGTETILLVEDEEMVRRLAKKILEMQGYSVIEKENGGLAMMWAEKNNDNIDLLLTDVIMPGMNGRDLLERLQQQRPGLRALFMSGYTENVIAHHGVLDEGTEFIQKPFSVGSLTRKVRDVLDS